MGCVNLELLAMRWLRWQKKCAIVIMERSPRSWSCGEPDVLGVTKDRYMTEIEVKRSMSDFRADFNKRSRINRGLYPERFPKKFYYLVPYELAWKVEPELPDWAGLMRGPGSEEIHRVYVVKASPTLKSSKRLSVKECAKLAMSMSNQILSLAERCNNLNGNRYHDEGNETWYLEFHPEYINFQI